MPNSYDLIVIGTGAAGAGAASRCREAGWKVAIVDSLPYGGTCQLRGCDPKKVLVGASEALDWVRRMEGKGIRAPGAAIDWPELMRFKQTFIDGVGEGNEKWLSDAGVEALHGDARFTAPTVVRVNGRELATRHVHIAAGAMPVDLKITGQEHLTDSTRFLDLERLPPRIVFVGGGFISFEFAHIAARAGARVTLLHRSARPLGGFDPDLVALLVERTRELGIEVHLEAEVSGIDRTAEGLTVRASTPGGTFAVEADLAVHGAGRVPDIAGLGLDDAGVELGPRGIVVNEYLQSVSNPAVYAAGDVAATVGLPLTPVAAYEGRIAASNMLDGNRHTVDYPAIPSAVFTVPPLASVGLQEEEARRQGLKFETHFDKTGSWYSFRRLAEPHGAYKVLVEEGSGRILGAHVLGPNAEELINLFSMAMRGGLKSQDIKDVIFTYPTFASDMGYMV